MFPRILIFVIISFFASAGFSQTTTDFKKKFYSKLTIGYGFISGGGYNTQVTEHADSSNTVTLRPFSYGKGLNFGYSLGAMFHPNIGAELGFSYLAGGNSKEDNFYYEGTAPNQFTVEQKISYKSSFFRVNPAIVLAAPGKKVTPYAKFGFLVGAGTATTDIEENAKSLSWGGGTGNGRFGWKLKGGIGFGYTSAIGLILSESSDDISFFAELSHISMTSKFDKAVRTKYTINGVDYLKDMDTNEKEVEFFDTIDNDGSFNPDKPAKDLRYKYSFDSFGFNIGFVIPMK